MWACILDAVFVAMLPIVQRPQEVWCVLIPAHAILLLGGGVLHHCNCCAHLHGVPGSLWHNEERLLADCMIIHTCGLIYLLVLSHGRHHSYTSQACRARKGLRHLACRHFSNMMLLPCLCQALLS